MAENRSHKLEVEGSSPSVSINKSLTNEWKKFDQKTLYWLAGLLEAEGSFIAPPPSEPNNPRISVAMTDEDVIARIAKIFGVKYHIWHPKNENHKTAYLAKLRGRRAVDLMQELYPLMSHRRQKQIDLALTNHVYRPDGKGENHGNSKLNDEKIREIKYLLAMGEKQHVIAQKFNISERAISDINCGKTWKHITV